MNLFNVHGQRLLKTGGNIFINLRTIEEYIFDTGNSETVKRVKYQPCLLLHGFIQETQSKCSLLKRSDIYINLRM